MLQTLATLLLSVALAGCVSKAKAREQARAAFLAGQQQAAQQLQVRGPFVTVVGPVKNTLLPWTADLTLAKGLIAAEYFGPGDPTEIVIRRSTEEIRVDAKRLLEGEDTPLLPRDVIDIIH
jgi:hypothetical protein